MKIGDGLIGVLVMLFAGAVFGISMTFPQQSSYFGPRLFPQVVSGGLLLFGAILIVRTIVARARDGAHGREGFSIGISGDLGSLRAVIMLLMIVGAVICYVEFLDVVGFQVLTACLLFVFYLVLGASLWRALVIAVVATFAFDLIFRIAMDIPLSSGLLESVIYH